MSAVVVTPDAYELKEVIVRREPGPPRLTADSTERADRVRAAIANSGFALPHGQIEVAVPDASPHHDLAVALAILLCDPAHKHLRRHGWLAWGVLGLDGSVMPADGPFVAGRLHSGPAAGRIWRPDDRLPGPDDDAVISVVDIEDLSQAWEVLTFMVGAEQVIVDGGETVTT
jgi:predicted ATPase with chaperone activity